MAAGNIIRKGTPQPELRLGFAARGFEPFIKYMMDTAATTLEATQAYLAEQKEANELLRQIAEDIHYVTESQRKWEKQAETGPSA